MLIVSEDHMARMAGRARTLVGPSCCLFYHADKHFGYSNARSAAQEVELSLSSLAGYLRPPVKGSNLSIVIVVSQYHRE